MSSCNLLPLCATCQLYAGVKSNIGFTCEAFPRGIPTDILVTRVDHRKPYKGDGGRQYVPLQGMDMAKEKKEKLVLDLDDDEGQLTKLLNHIKDTASIGHSFDVVVDPGDSEYEAKFFIDGDGAFRIKDMKVATDIASDPPVSEKQRRAMWAAASGHSTLGIPKSVGKEFSEADPGGELPESKDNAETDLLEPQPKIHVPKVKDKHLTKDMEKQDWRGLFKGLFKFLSEEAEEPEHQEPNTGAGVAIVNKDGKVLFLKRSGHDNADYKDHWAFPGGGKEDSETPKETAIREAKEEIGDVCNLDNLDCVDTHDGFSTFHQMVESLFEPRLNEEHSEYKWEYPENAPQPLHPGVKHTLDKVLSHLEEAEDNSWPSEDDWSPEARKAAAEARKNNSRVPHLHMTASPATGSKPAFRAQASHMNEVHQHLNNLHAHIKKNNLPEHRVSIENKHTGETHSASVAPHGIFNKTFDKRIRDARYDKKAQDKDFSTRYNFKTWPIKGRADKTIPIQEPDGEDEYHPFSPPENTHFSASNYLDKKNIASKVGGFDKEFSTRYYWKDWPIKGRADKTIQVQKPTGAQDEALAGHTIVLARALPLAYDRISNRIYDDVGRLKVADSNISKATVNPYKGEEIPDWEKLSLDPKKIYQLLRHPDELEKGASSFNLLPILDKHVPVTAEKPSMELAIGSTGSHARFEPPYLKNDIAFWPKKAIDDIDGGRKKQLSCAYSYEADMTPGIYEGMPYDGIMRNIKGNHVALVPEGRAGPDVMVHDSALGDFIEESDMPKYRLSPKALYAKGSIETYLYPRLALDARIDLRPILEDVTSKNFKDKKPIIESAVRRVVKGKLAQDADVEDLPELLQMIEHQKGEDEPNGGMPMGMPMGHEMNIMDRLRGMLKDRLAPDALDMVLDAVEMCGTENEPPYGGANYNEEPFSASEDERKDAEDWDRRRKDAEDRLGRDESEEEREEREERECEDSYARDYHRARDRYRRASEDRRRADDKRDDADDKRDDAEDRRRRDAEDRAKRVMDRAGHMMRRHRAADKRDDAEDRRRRADDRMHRKDADDRMRMRKADDRMGRNMRMRAEDDPPDFEGKPEVGGGMSKEAMDAAIAKAVSETKAEQRAIREAENFIRPIVGKLNLAFDSVEEAYAAALRAKGVNIKGLHPSAYRSVLEVIAKNGQNSNRQQLASDSKLDRGNASKLFPDSARISVM